MNKQAVQLLSRAIVRLMNRDQAEFERLVELTEREHDQNRHLYISITDLLEWKEGKKYEA